MNYNPRDQNKSEKQRGYLYDEEKKDPLLPREDLDQKRKAPE